MTAPWKETMGSRTASEREYRLSRKDLREYWAGLSRDYLDDADKSLGVIVYAGMPSWFNRFVDLYERKALERLLSREDIRGKRVLDIGTGIGRWARWYSRWPETEVVGIDLEPSRLASARARDPDIAYLEMPISQLAFPDASFDIVNSVAVLQHVDHATKREAIAEIARVLRPGGAAVIFELTDVHDDAPHVFAWPDATWRAEFVKNGLLPERVIGEQYVPLIRALKTANSLFRRGKSRESVQSLKAGEASAALRLLKLAVVASYSIEEVARFLPARFARVRGYLLRKTSADKLKEC